MLRATPPPPPPFPLKKDPSDAIGQLLISKKNQFEYHFFSFQYDMVSFY